MTTPIAYTDPCDEDGYNTISRRDFGALALGSGLVAATGTRVWAADVKETDVTIRTPDGMCDAVLTHPASGSHPAVLVWPDIGGLRPVFRDMGKRLAAEGYTVLTPNPFYRVVHAAKMSEVPQAERAKFREGLFAEGGAEKDAATFIAFLDGQSPYKKGAKIGTTGYCMGGPLTMRTAAWLNDRIGAAASFHGGGLATDAPNSPHLLVPKIKAKYLFAVAQNDDKTDPEAKNKLKAAFDAAKNSADIEVYAADHGWCVPGGGRYNEAEAERAWSKMLALFARELQGKRT